MAQKSRRKTRESKYLGNHQRCWIWGRHLLLETLNAGKWPPVELYLSTELDSVERERVQSQAEELDLTVVVESSERIGKLCHAKDHQGYAAKMPPFPYTKTQDILQFEKPDPFFVILDSIQDSHNLGAIVRTAEVLGVDAVVLSDRDQVDVNSQVARSSVGAVNYIPIAKPESLLEFLRELKSRNVHLLGTHRIRGENLPGVAIPIGGLACVIGSESWGISEDVMEFCDSLVRIPQAGKIESLNAAVAAGIVMYEVFRQRLAP